MLHTAQSQHELLSTKRAREVDREIMPRPLTQYRVFIGSPSGLEDERKRFRNTLEKFNQIHGEPAGVIFHAVAWEDTLNRDGRPQEIINRDIEGCDYALFVFHDRWGSPTGSGYSSGTEEGIDLAQKLRDDAKIRLIALFFKTSPGSHLPDPDQLRMVNNFRNKIEKEKKHLSKSYRALDEFCDTLEAHLANWLRDHQRTASGGALAGPAATDSPDLSTEKSSQVGSATSAPDFEYWIAEALRLTGQEINNYPAALFCAYKATDAATSDMEWARATNTSGIAQFHLNRLDEAFKAFAEITERFADATEGPGQRDVSDSSGQPGDNAKRARAQRRGDRGLRRCGGRVSARRPSCRCASRSPRRFSIRGSASARLIAAKRKSRFTTMWLTRFGAATELSLREQVGQGARQQGVPAWRAWPE